MISAKKMLLFGILFLMTGSLCACSRGSSSSGVSTESPVAESSSAAGKQGGNTGESMDGSGTGEDGARQNAGQSGTMGESGTNNESGSVADTENTTGDDNTRSGRNTNNDQNNGVDDAIGDMADDTRNAIGDMANDTRDAIDDLTKGETNNR